MSELVGHHPVDLTLARVKADGTEARASHATDGKETVVRLGERWIYGTTTDDTPMVFYDPTVHSVVSSLGAPEIITEMNIAGALVRSDEFLQITLKPGHRPGRNNVSGVIVSK